MKTIFLALLALSLSAQTATTTYSLSGPASARAGQTVQVSVVAQDGADTQGSAWQWSATFPAGVTVNSPAVNPALANTLLTCAAASQTSNCILYPNVTSIPAGSTLTKVPNGPLATYAVQLPASASGSLAFQIAGVYGATPTAGNVPTTAGTPYQLTILLKEDIDGDGKVTLTDISLMSQEALAATSNPSACVHDIDGDGKCTVTDIVAVILKYLGF